jgi:hypothetical protein
MERHVLAKAQQSLRPELFARITEKLVFNRLSYDVRLKSTSHPRQELAVSVVVVLSSASRKV